MNPFSSPKNTLSDGCRKEPSRRLVSPLSLELLEASLVAGNLTAGSTAADANPSPAPQLPLHKSLHSPKSIVPSPSEACLFPIPHLQPHPIGKIIASSTAVYPNPSPQLPSFPNSMDYSPSEACPSSILHPQPPPRSIKLPSPDTSPTFTPRLPLQSSSKESSLPSNPNQPFPPIENQIIQRNKELHQAKEGLEHQHTSEEEVDLADIMKSLQIEIPEDIGVGYQGEEAQKQEVNSPFKRLIKVASSSGTPRNIPLKVLKNAMSSAWGDSTGL